MEGELNLEELTRVWREFEKRSSKKEFEEEFERVWKRMEGELNLEELTEQEMEVVMTVFRSYETGLREATIYPKDLHNAMKMLGLNPMEQEIIDLTNNISRNIWQYIWFQYFNFQYMAYDQQYIQEYMAIYMISILIYN